MYIFDNAAVNNKQVLNRIILKGIISAVDPPLLFTMCIDWIMKETTKHASRGILSKI